MPGRSLRRLRVRRLRVPVVDPAYCEDLHGRLSGLVILLGHCMKSEAANLIYHLAGVDGYGLALEELAGYLALAGTPITGQQHNDMRTLAAEMQTGGNVRLTLAFCPRVM